MLHVVFGGKLPHVGLNPKINKHKSINVKLQGFNEVLIQSEES